MDVDRADQAIADTAYDVADKGTSQNRAPPCSTVLFSEIALPDRAVNVGVDLKSAYSVCPQSEFPRLAYPSPSSSVRTEYVRLVGNGSSDAVVLNQPGMMISLGDRVQKIAAVCVLINNLRIQRIANGAMFALVL